MDELAATIKNLALKIEPIYTLKEFYAHKFISDNKNNSVSEEEYTQVCKDKFRSYLYTIDAFQFEIIKILSTKEPEEEWYPNEDQMKPLISLVLKFFVYSFWWNDVYHAVLPKELIEVYEEVISEPEFLSHLTYRQELSRYANALANLYGYYFLHQFVDVWNQHHREKISGYDVFDLLEEISYDKDSVFSISDDEIFRNTDLNDEDLEELMERTDSIDYYFPTKSEIRLYAKEYFDLLPGSNEMRAFINKYIPTALGQIALNHSIIQSCERDYGPYQVRGLLKHAELPLDDETVVTRFEKLYRVLQRSVHVWELRGHTSYLFSQLKHRQPDLFVLPRD